MENIVVQMKTGHLIVGPAGFCSYAEDFLNAYKCFETDKFFSPAKYYLVCRSIELSLKSYLLLKNVPINKVKCNLGHDLHRILRKSKELGIDTIIGVTDEEKVEVERANGWYKRKGFEYFDIQNIVEIKTTLPDLNILLNFAERLINELKPICLSSMQQL